MQFPALSLSLCSALYGLVMGLAYGVLMLIQRRKLQNAAGTSISKSKIFIMMATISSLRVGILAIALLYLLRAGRADPIILVVSFLAAFFLTLITERAVKGGRL